jgi:ribonuclease HI
VGLIVNTDKTTFDLYTLHQLKTLKPADFSIILNNSQLKHAANPVYLGITMDTKMTGKPHMEKAAAKGRKRLLLMKRAASVKWGSNQEVLTLTYGTYVRPAMEAGSEVFVASAKSVTDPLEVVQNQALRIITGGVKTTPIAAMQMHADTLPLAARRDAAAINLHEKLAGLDPSWDRKHTAVKKQHVTFLQKVTELKSDLKLNPLLRQKRDPITHPSLESMCTEIKCQTTIPGVERVGTVQERRDATYKYLRNKYPLPNWLRVYTDGSAAPGQGDAGAGWHSDHFSGCAAAGKYGSALSGELLAVSRALSKAEELLPIRHLVLLLDSVAAIAAITSGNPTDPMALQCREKIGRMQRHREVVLQWIPGHCDIAGNEHADKLAHMGAKLPQERKRLSVQALKPHVREAVRAREVNGWLEKSQGEPWAALIKPHTKQTKREAARKNMPRATAVANFRLNTGHDLLGAHLSRFNIIGSNICSLCKTHPQDRAHLFKCAALQSEFDMLPPNMTREEKESRLYWLARHMAQQAS